ncbi:hypothetical protein PVK06_007914 [Gossypium arboreum]|uniref:Uncharacterized protein n=1 Tax=Gossypium arboreum TaxID=29729 RepID=A0ABR0QJG4_GOSAR|nr:hypothetical protein PVK06_007914 [Gossypium arboreum]
MERMLLLYAILTEKSVNVGKIILKEIYDCAKKKTVSDYFPSLITSLCLRARIKTQANLKGQYVQGCITIQDLERLVEKVHKLNQGEQEEPTELDTKESTNEIETKLVIATEEKESDKEPNSPKSVEGSKNPEPSVELEEEPVKLSVESEYRNPMPTVSSTSRKLELSILMDMCKFMHNQ